MNLGKSWVGPNDQFGGVLDTGFTGGALCSKRWLKTYEDYMMKYHKSKKFTKEKTTMQRFIFGSDQGQALHDLLKKQTKGHRGACMEQTAQIP